MNSKKTLAILIVASMLCSTSVSAQPFDNSELEYETVQTEKVNASSGTCGENLTWTLDDSGTLTITGTGNMYNYSYNDESPFYDNDSIKTVVIKNGVTSIGNYAFSSCSGLTSVTIGDSVTSIGNSAFADCYRLTSVTIPDSVTSIGDSAFYNCSSLTSITIPYSVTSIGKRAFYDCYKLTSIVIPDSVTSIGEEAFFGLSLTSITVDENNKYYSNNEHGVLFNKDKTVLIQYPSENENSSYTIPDSVTSIGAGAFCNCYNLTSIVIPDSVTSIGEEAFIWTSLTSIVIPDSVTSIGDCAFFDNTRLTSVTIGDGVTSIGVNAFYRCYLLASVTMGDSVTSIGWGAFACCSNLTSVTLPNSVTNIDIHAFSDSGLTSIVISDSVTNIGNYAFFECDSLTSIVVDENNEYYSNDEYGVLFNKDKTTLIQYPGGGNSSYVIPGSVTSIGKSAFECCSNLTSIIISDSVTSIGERGFFDCYNLTSVAFGDSVASIGEYAFYDCSSLTSITIPNSVTSIGNSAFYYCSSLTSIVIPDSVTSIGTYAFTYTGYYENEENWTDSVLYIGNHLTAAKEDVSGDYSVKQGTLTIAGAAFYDCSSLTSIVIPDSVTSIGNYAFRGCSSLTSVTIPDSVTSIGNYAFCYCSSLTSITIPDGVTSISEGAFARSNFTSITIPDNVTNIGDYAFYECSNLTSVTIPNGVTSIGKEAFYSCSSLTDVFYNGSEEEWNNIQIKSDNDPLLNATIHFNVASEDEETYIEQGKCGDDLDYTLSKDGTLTITGTGDMTNYSWSSVAPWYDNRSSIKTVTIGDGVTSIGTEAFSECSSLTSATIGDDVTSIGMEAFSKCSSLTSVTIGDSVTSIGEGAFSDCSSLTSITIPDSVTSIDPYAFYCCSSLTSVTIGDGVTSIGGHAFYCCSNLTSILIPDSVTSIGSRAFSGSGLTSVTIPDSVTSIGEEAFICSSITSITVDTNNEYYSSDEYGALFNKDKTELIQYPIGNERTSYTIPNSVISIGYRAFDNCSSLTSITIPDSVTSIGYEAFADCSSLTSVVIPDSVTSIGDYAFCKCSSLIEITIPEHLLANINDTVFEGCNLEKINVRSSTIDGVYDISIDIINTDKLPNSVKLEEAGYSSNVLIIQNDDGVSIGSTDLSKISNIIVSYGSDPDAPIDSHKIYICTSDGTVLGSAQLSQKGDFWAEGQRAVIIPVSTDYSGEIVIKKDDPGHWIAIDMIMLLSDTKTESETIYGDANGDGAVNGKDVLTLRKYMVNYDYDTGTSSVEVSSGADANGDGVINGKDVLLMRKYMVNYDYETGTSSVKLGPSLPELPDGFTLIDISELEKTFLTDHPDLIPGQKDRHYGVRNKNGDVVIPFEYDSLVAPTSDGHTLVGKQSTEIIDGEEVTVYDDYLFDKDGNVVYSTHSYGWPYNSAEERLGFYQNELMITYRSVPDDEYAYIYYLRRLDGSLIRTIEYVFGTPASSYAECIILPIIPPEGDTKTLLIDFNGETVRELPRGWYTLPEDLGTGIYGDYYMMNKFPTDTYILCKSDGSEEYEYFGVNFSYAGHYGTTIIGEDYDTGKYILLDATILDSLEKDYNDPTWYSEAIISEYEYDHIACRIFRDRDEKYFRVSRDEKVGYLSYDLKTEVLYDDSSEFINGKAIIREGDKFYVINNSFEKISDEITGYGDFGLSAIGENMYTLTKGDTFYLLIHDCE